MDQNNIRDALTINMLGRPKDFVKFWMESVIQVSCGNLRSNKFVKGCTRIDDASNVIGPAVFLNAHQFDSVMASTQGDDASEYASFTGDAAKGRRIFAKCMACHTVQEGQNRVGPSLYGIIGRDAGSIAGFKYSDANANSRITWTDKAMFAYLENPQEFIPGTRMIFPGLPAAQERADVIAYLKSAAE